MQSNLDYLFIRLSLWCTLVIDKNLKAADLIIQFPGKYSKGKGIEYLYIVISSLHVECLVVFYNFSLITFTVTFFSITIIIRKYQ